MDIDTLRASLAIWTGRRERAKEDLLRAEGALAALTEAIGREQTDLAATGTEDARIVAFPFAGGVEVEED